ncbi:MAG TPA: hypothetical protein VK497_06070 [Candidatus Saccharimonadales bacterium]|nr:hypothetical protein [Candidatus Saccharimonadales bacterium]
MEEARNPHKIIQIATVGYGMSNSDYVGAVEQLIVLTSEGELFIRDLSTKGSKWKPLEGPVLGTNIGEHAHADQQPLSYG